MNVDKQIFISLSTFSQYSDEPLDLLKQSKYSYTINPTGKRATQKEIFEMGNKATVIVAGVEPYTKEVLKRLTHLKCISRAGVGIDSIDLDFAKSKEITILNTPNVIIQPVVELTLAFIFDLSRKITQHTNWLRANKWEKSAGNNIFGKKIGIIGTGRIGKAVCEVLSKLGAKVIAYDIKPDTSWSKAQEIKYVSFEELLSDSDIISLHLSGTEGKVELFGSKEFSLMKQGALLINTSRGYLVNEDALYQALSKGQLSAAGIDVFPEEPYSGKLLELENILLTPHIATLTKESRTQMEIEAVQNAIHFLNKLQ